MRTSRTFSPDFGFVPSPDALSRRLSSEAAAHMAEVPPAPRLPADPRPGLTPPPGGWDRDEIAREDDDRPGMGSPAALVVLGAVAVILALIGRVLLAMGGAP